MKKKKKKDVIYSTNPNFEFEYENIKIDTPKAKEQNLKVCIDKHRSGKTAIIIKNFEGKDKDLKALAKMLKIKCGVGGNTKNGEIIIQGDLREKVIYLLDKEGYKYKRVGG